MSQLQEQSISQDRFLTMAANLLHRAFIEASRTEAKKLYRALAEGQKVGLSRVEMEDKSILEVGLCLDHSEFRGKLNYGAFRASVATLLAQTAETLKEEKPVPTFTPQSGEGATIFGITAVTVEDDKPNVMVLASETGAQATVMLQLMYVDPQQFNTVGATA
jgi:hypothetical protein